MDAVTLALAKKYTDEHGGGGEGDTTNYNALTNKPKINGVELSGNKTANDLGLVSAESGKGLSTEDYTAAEKSKLAGIAERATDDYTALTNKPKINGVELSGNKTANDLGLVSAESGKGLSTEDYTAAEKSKLAGIAERATDDYTALTNKPKINGVELSGNKSASDLGIHIPDSTSELTNDSGFITESETDKRITEKVAEIVADAPEDFDTLKEISDWISGHEKSAAAMNSAISANASAISSEATARQNADALKADKSTTYTKTEVDSALSGKVDKVSGKGLSTNDYTTAEKTKLAGLENYDDSAVKSGIALNRQTAGTTCKNLCPITEGSVESNGFVIPKYTPVYLLPSEYIFSGSVQNAVRNAQFVLYDSNKAELKTVTINHDQSSTAENFSVQFSFPNGARYIGFYSNGGTYSNLMLRSADITDDTFEPCKPSLQEQIGQLWNVGSKNLFDFTTWKNHITGANNGTVSVKDDSITLTATSADAYTTPQISGFHIYVKPLTKYTLSFESDDSNGNFVLLENDEFSTFYVLNNGIKTLTFQTSATANRLSIRFGVSVSGKSSTANNVMLRSADIEDDTFAPYAPTNRELYEMILALQNGT